MAGRLPGVGLPPRKRSENHHRYEHHATYRDSYLRESLESPWISLSALDETALRARQRLQKKLGHFFSSSRSSDSKKKDGKISQRTFKIKDACLGRKLLDCSWLILRPNRFKKERKVCAVCLEDFQQEQQVMNLNCSHKYHSACLLPWLADHPHCPCCRTPVVP
ncbi:uncharacterized protein LOC133318206 [Gastrolobium bilobum]|uniref:uncharacterized protein LOC133318206 n=1 Tax=Gastrolobium bilobum TaxID=150636 RepID=UPI002AB11B9F|nr:uncharacterized protein LOC133318206 [Gastrolobium bilobum]